MSKKPSGGGEAGGARAQFVPGLHLPSKPGPQKFLNALSDRSLTDLSDPAPPPLNQQGLLTGGRDNRMGICAGIILHKRRIFVDAGADISVMDRGAAEAAGLEILELDRHEGNIAVADEGINPKWLGKVITGVFLDGTLFEVSFLIPRTHWTHDQYDAILGTDFLSQLGRLIISWQEGNFVLHDVYGTGAQYCFPLAGGRRPIMECGGPPSWELKEGDIRRQVPRASSPAFDNPPAGCGGSSEPDFLPVPPDPAPETRSVASTDLDAPTIGSLVAATSVSLAAETEPLLFPPPPSEDDLTFEVSPASNVAQEGTWDADDDLPPRPSRDPSPTDQSDRESRRSANLRALDAAQSQAEKSDLIEAFHISYRKTENLATPAEQTALDDAFRLANLRAANLAWLKCQARLAAEKRAQARYLARKNFRRLATNRASGKRGRPPKNGSSGPPVGKSKHQDLEGDLVDRVHRRANKLKEAGEVVKALRKAATGAEPAPRAVSRGNAS